MADPRLTASLTPSAFPLRSRKRQASRHTSRPFRNCPQSSGTAAMFGRKKSETEDRKMSDAPDDLGIPMKPARNIPDERARPERNVAPLGPRRATAAAPGTPADPPRAAQEARGRPISARARPAGRCRRPRRCRAPQRRRSAQADRRPRDLAVRRDQLLRQADHRRQRRSQSAELPRCRARRIGPVQGLGDDRRDRGARPLRGQSDRAQAPLIRATGTGFRHDPLRPDRDRVRRPDLGRHTGHRRQRAARDVRKPRRVLTAFVPASYRSARGAEGWPGFAAG